MSQAKNIDVFQKLIPIKYLQQQFQMKIKPTKPTIGILFDFRYFK